MRVERLHKLGKSECSSTMVQSYFVKYHQVKFWLHWQSESLANWWWITFCSVRVLNVFSFLLTCFGTHMEVYFFQKLIKEAKTNMSRKSNSASRYIEDSTMSSLRDTYDLSVRARDQCPDRLSIICHIPLYPFAICNHRKAYNYVNCSSFPPFYAEIFRFTQFMARVSTLISDNEDVLIRRQLFILKPLSKDYVEPSLISMKKFYIYTWNATVRRHELCHLYSYPS